MAKDGAIVCTCTGGKSMVPYQGRTAIRVARVVLALSCLAWYPFTAGAGISSSLVFLIAYAIFAVGTLFETRFDSAPRAIVALVIDFAFFTWSRSGCCRSTGLRRWLTGSCWFRPPLLHEFVTVLVVAGLAMLLIVLLTAPGGGLIWADWAAAGMAVAFSFTNAISNGACRTPCATT